MKTRLQTHIHKIKNQAALKASLQTHKELILNQANDLLNQCFYFNDTWDMEPCAIPYSFETMDWNACPNGDDEWTFMLHRMSFLEKLAYASILTDETVYLEKAWFYIRDWILSCVESRTLDTAMRLSHWIEIVPYFDGFDILANDDYALLEKSMMDQIQFMFDRYLVKYTLSNWGSIQTSAIIQVLDCLGYTSNTSKIYAWAEKELIQQLQIQVYPDGLHWEQSTMYHCEVMAYGIKANRVLKHENLRRTLHSMALAVLYQRTPDNTIVMFGDSDKSHLGSLMSLCAHEFKDGRFVAFMDPNFDYELLYVGMALEPLEVCDLDTLNYDGVDSGMYTTRSSWGRDANFTFFTNGSLGSGHGHADNLHFATYYAGDPVFVDSGRFTYREDVDIRVQLKKMSAHNSIVIDNMPVSEPSGSWTNARFVTPLKNYNRHEGVYHYYEGAIIDETMSHVRKLTVVDEGIWCISDEVRCAGTHEAVLRFHLDKTCRFESGYIITEHNHRLQFVCESDVHLLEEDISYIYNQKDSHWVLELRVSFTDRLVHNVVVCPQAMVVEKTPVIQGKDRVMDASEVSAFTFDHRLTLALVHQEIWSGNKILSIDSRPFHAKTIIMDEEDTFILRT